jgi:ferric iron reductase protein FhuF
LPASISVQQLHVGRSSPAHRTLPALVARADAVLDALLGSGPLAGTGRRREDGSFVRRSCCLFYRLPGAGTCGDCILDARA